MDPVDLIVGILLAVCLPFLGYFGVRFMQANSPGAEPTVKEMSDDDAPKPDVEEVTTRLQYIRRMYLENAVVFLDRAKKEDPRQQFHEMKWAITALRQVKADLSGLESLILRTQSAATFQTELEELARLRHSVDEGVRKVSELDHLGVLNVTD